MATGTGRTTSSTGRTTKKAASAKPAAARTRSRSTSKPLIIDVEADAKATATTPAEETAKAKADTGAATAAKKAAPAKAAMPSQPEASPAPKASAGPASTPDAQKSAQAKAPPSKDGAQTVVPPGGGAAAKEKSGGSMFLVLAAGVIGALLALVLFFLANTIGLFTLDDGRVDSQAAALVTLESRVAALENFDASDVTANADGIAALQANVDALRADVGAVAAGLGAGSDAGPAALGDEAVAAMLEPLEVRLSALEAQVTGFAQNTQSSDTAEAESSSATSSAGQASVAALSAQLSALATDVSSLQTDVTALQAASDSVAAPAAARLDVLDGLVADADSRLAALTEEVALLGQNVEQNGERMATFTADLQAMAAAPITAAPDQLARLGLALDALETARDAGGEISGPLAAATQAASFDPVLSAALMPLSDLSISTGLDRPSLLAVHEASLDAMRAAAPADQGGGLLGALEDRARQMVSIRAPEGALIGDAEDPFAQAQNLGALIAQGAFGDALAAFSALPEAMQSVGGDFGAALQARVSLDNSLADTRGALIDQLTQAQMSVPDAPASDGTSQ